MAEEQIPFREIDVRPEDFPDAPPTSFLPPYMYVDPWVHTVEQRDVFPRTWQPVATTEKLVGPGDYITERVGDQPVMVLRDADGALRCFANACRHRVARFSRGSATPTRPSCALITRGPTSSTEACVASRFAASSSSTSTRTPCL